MRVLGRFVLQVELPALLFSALATRPLADVLHPGYLLAYATGSLAVLGGALWWNHRVKGRHLTESAYVAMGMSCSNSGYVGYPVMLLTFGPLAGVILALNLLVENILKLPLLFALADLGGQVQGRGSAGQVLWQTLKGLARTPMLLAIFAGVLVSASGGQLPGVLHRTVQLFSGATSGLALFIIGGNLVGLSLAGMRRRVGLIAAGKLVLHPLAVWMALWVWPRLGGPDVSSDLARAAVLSAAMPMLGIYALLAQRHGHQGFAAAALLGTTAASFLSLSGLLWLMGLG
jgi:predicted permease